MKRILVIMVGVLVLLTFGGCSGYSGEQAKNDAQIAAFQQSQPVPVITFSNTRQAVIDRINRWNDPHKISYIYLVSFGRVMAFYTVKGSVESKRSFLSPMDRVVGSSGAVLQNADVDGTYGENADSIFFFTTDSVYVEWHGDYMWVDQPLKLATQPELIYIAPLK